jgi:hypothetical protein
MAFQINPNIPLSAQQSDVLSTLSQGVQAGGMFQKLRQQAEEAPIRQELLNQQAQAGQAAQAADTAAAAKAEQNRVIASIAGSYSGVKSLVDSGKYNDAADALEANKEVLRQSGVTNFEDSDLAIQALRSGDAQAIRNIQLQGEQAIQLATDRNLLGDKDASAETKSFNKLIANMSPEDQDKARRIKAGLDARAVGSAALTTAETGKTDIVAESEAEIAAKKAGAVEAAKLSKQLKLKPEVEAAVRSAVDQAVEAGARSQEVRSNSKALAIYEAGVNGLVSGLSETTTGPIVGFLPALTANAQIADGAVAIMAPILKQIFREAGEGSFSDGDQKLLIDMIPTRKDKEEARIGKLKNIDAIVRAKLAGGSASEQAPQTQDTGITAEQFRAMSPAQRAATLQQIQGGQ